MRGLLVAFVMFIALGVLAAACSGSSSKSPTATTSKGKTGGKSQITTALQVGTATAPVGSTAQAGVRALGVGAPGLGAWTFDIDYDPAIVSVTDCTGAGTVACNKQYQGHSTVRLAGATAQGFTGDVTLETITFQCIAAGASPLKLSIAVLADSTVGNPLNIPNPGIQDGSITCS